MTRTRPRGRHLSRHRYDVGGRSLHLRDALLTDLEPSALGLNGGEGPGEVANRISALFGGRLSPARVVVMRTRPRVLALVLESQPGVHPEGDLTLEEIVADPEVRLPLLPRRLSAPVTPKREGERALSVEEATADHPGGSPCRRIVFHFSKIEVGLGDRLVGLASVMVLARAVGAEVVLDRPFLTDLFDNAVTQDDEAPRYQIDFLDTRFRYARLLAETDLSSLGAVAHAIGNECFHYALYQNPRFRERLRGFDTDLREAYRDIFGTLLRPRPVVTDAVSRLVAERGTRSLVGVQLRTGLLQREFPHVSPSDLVRYCHAIADTLPGSKSEHLAFVTADDNRMASMARNILERSGVATIAMEAPVLHISYQAHRACGDARLKLVTDLLTLARCDRLFISLHSNFGRVAYLLGAPAETWGMYGRNFDLVPLTDAYLASSKHLVYSDSVMAQLGGLLGFRYHGELDALGRAALVIRAIPQFAAAASGTVLRRGRLPFREGLRLFMEALHAAEEAR